jgi:DNA polymerase III sliding clamp (beta) subunit (PCNA family)
VPVDYRGEDIDVTFNPDYVVDYLKVVPDETVELHLKDRASAGFSKAVKIMSTY